MTFFLLSGLLSCGIVIGLFGDIQHNSTYQLDLGCIRVHERTMRSLECGLPTGHGVVLWHCCVHGV
jgi:hypothetical protein